MPKGTLRNILAIVGMKADELRELFQVRRIRVMIMAILSRGMARQNPKRHVHAGRPQELAMIMGLVPVGDGRTNPPVPPARPPA
jgi:hypothetical protein